VTGFRSFAAHQILFGDRMKKEEIGGTCGTRGGERRCIRCDGLVWTMEGKGPFARHSRTWEDSNKINLTALRCEGKEWIHLASEKGKWLAVVSTLRRKLRSVKFCISALLERTFACPEGLCSMQLASKSLTVRHLPSHSSAQ